jgi:hypothetical protein
MNSAAWKPLAVLFVLALAARLGAGWLYQSRLEGRFGMPDSESYWQLAETIARGEPYQFGPEHYQVFRAPGYPLLLAPILCVASGQTAVMLARAESALLGTLAVVGVWWWARQLFEPATGLIAAAIAAFYPGAIAIGTLILSEAPFCALLPAQMILWTAAWKANSLRRSAWLALFTGLISGAATLMRPSWLMFTPLAVVLGIIISKRNNVVQNSKETRLAADGTSAPPSDERSFRPLLNSEGRTLLNSVGIGLAMLAGLAIAMTPWWIRNARVTGHFVPTTLQVGASLYDGLNPEATGASNMDFVPGFVAQERRLEAEGDAQAEQEFEFRLDRRLRSAAIDWALHNPGRALQLAAVKFGRIWNIWPNEPSLSTPAIRLMTLVTYVPVLLLGLFGAIRTIRSGLPYLLCWLPAVYFSGLHMIFVSSIRYREPAMLGLIVLAAGVLGKRMKNQG